MPRRVVEIFEFLEKEGGHLSSSMINLSHICRHVDMNTISLKPSPCHAQEFQA